ncbi:NAD(P)-dependent oxidoreductase [Flavitalea flava]
MSNNETSVVKKILVIGANGGIGKQAVEIALQAGHQVTALLRNPDNLPLTHPNLEKIKGDIFHTDIWDRHLAGKDVVISAIGVKGGFGADKPTTLYSQGNFSLLAAMEKRQIARVFFISASAIEISPVLPWYVRLIEKYVVQKLLKHMYADLHEMESGIKDSGLDWTIIRPPQLSDKPATGKYRVAINEFLKNCLKISRADVAHYMVNNIDNVRTYRGTIEIGY